MLIYLQNRIAINYNIINSKKANTYATGVIKALIIGVRYKDVVREPTSKPKKLQVLVGDANVAWQSGT